MRAKKIKHMKDLSFRDPNLPKAKVVQGKQDTIHKSNIGSEVEFFKIASREWDESLY